MSSLWDFSSRKSAEEVLNTFHSSPLRSQVRRILSSISAVASSKLSHSHSLPVPFYNVALAAAVMRFSLETIAEGLETDSDDIHGSASDVLARHLPPLLWKRIRKTEALLGLMATSCCLASKKRPDLFAPLSRK